MSGGTDLSDRLKTAADEPPSAWSVQAARLVNLKEHLPAAGAARQVPMGSGSGGDRLLLFGFFVGEKVGVTDRIEGVERIPVVGRQREIILDPAGQIRV